MNIFHKVLWSVNALGILQRLREAILRERADLRKDNLRKSHHENKHAHTSLLVQQYLARNNTVLIQQPQY